MTAFWRDRADSIDYILFLKNFVGYAHGFGGDSSQVTAAIEKEVVLMGEAADAEDDADRFGRSLMKDLLVNGKDERKRLFLAHLQKKCWDDLSE